MTSFKLFMSMVLMTCISACGQIVEKNLTVPANQQVASSRGQTIVSLPLADYTYDNGSDISTACRRNLLLQEVIMDQLVAQGFMVPVQEDVYHYMADNKLIKVVDQQEGSSTSSTLSRDLDKGGWSFYMQSKIEEMTGSQNDGDEAGTGVANPADAPGTHGLERLRLADIGSQFGAEYVLRGRLVKFGMGQDHTWSPLRKGLLPFVYGSANRIVFGITTTEKYDTISSMAVAGVMGAVLGNNLESPFEKPEKVTGSTSTGGAPLPFSQSSATSSVSYHGGNEDYRLLNSLSWGAATAATAYLAEQGGKNPEAVIQLRLWLQNSASGRVVWTNGAVVRVSPNTVFADHRRDVLVSTAIKNAAAALINDLGRTI